MKKEKYKSKVFTGIFLILFGVVFGGVPLLLSIADRNVSPMIFIFVIIGAGVFAGGIAFIIKEIKKGRIVNELIYRNEYIYAEFDSVKEVYHSDEDSSYYTYYALFRYNTPMGGPVFFESEEYSGRKMVPFKPGDSAKVFVDMSNPSVYMVSLNDTLHSDDPRYVEQEKNNGFMDKLQSVSTIAGGALFVIVPMFFAVFILSSAKTTVPVLLILLLFFGTFIAVGAVQIVKGVKELIKK